MPVLRRALFARFSVKCLFAVSVCEVLSCAAFTKGSFIKLILDIMCKVLYNKNRAGGVPDFFEVNLHYI